MKITLNKHKVKLTTADNLSIEQYLQLSEKENITIIDYLNATTDFKVLDIARTGLSNRHLRRLNNYIGSIKTFEELAKIKQKSIIFEDKLYQRDNLDCLTFGARVMLEARQKETQNPLKLAVYLLAILIEGNFDADKTDVIYNKLLKLSYIDYLPFAVFFFKRLTIGKYKGPRLLSFLPKTIKKILKKR